MPSNELSASLQSFRNLLKVVRRRALFIIFIIVAVPSATVLAESLRTDEFKATTTVLLNRQSLANQLSGVTDVGLQQQSFQQVLLTQAKLARTQTVLADAARSGSAQLGRPVSAAVLAAASQADVDPNSDLIQFSVRSSVTRSASVLSVAYAAAYVRYRLDLDTAALRKASADVGAAITEARRQRSTPTRLIGQLETSKQQLETRLALQSANAQIVSGNPGAERTTPDLKRAAIIGAVLALLVAAAAVTVIEFLDTKVRDPEEIEAALGVTVAAAVRWKGRRSESELPMRDDPASTQAEVYRVLRTSLNLGLATREAKTLMVTSAVQGEGKSTTIANVALSFALAGKRVALVDLDLRRPKVASLFDVASSVGLTSVAVGDCTVDEALHTVPLGASRTEESVGELVVLPPGPLPPDPAEFVGSPSVVRVVETLASTYDIVLVDAPPIAVIGDAMIIAEHVDAAFVCCRIGVIRRPMVRQLKRALDGTSLPVIGVVATGDLERKSDFGSYYYGYESPSSGADANG